MGISPSIIARVTGIETTYKDLRAGGILFLKQRIVVLGQGNTASTYSLEKTQVTSAGQAAEKYGYGSPIHLAVRKLLPANGDGVGTIPVTVYPLEDAGTGVEATGDITPTLNQTNAQSYRINVNNIYSNQFVLDDTDDVASTITKMITAINGVLEMPVIASDGTTKLNLTSKWKGLSANDIKFVVELVGDGAAESTFAYSAMSGGLVNPDVTDALALMGSVWETMILNCLNISDTDTLDIIQTFGEGRWGQTVKKPLVCFTGNTATTISSAITVSDARKTDRINAQLVAPGSYELPFAVAARQLARIAVVAQEDPPHDYGSQNASGIEPGTDGEQWDLTEQNQAILGGSSTINVVDGEIYIADVVTFYHPSGEEVPPYRYVVDIVKLMNVIFNIDLEFASTAWDGAALIPDTQPTVSKTAKKPKMAVASAAAIIDSLALNAIISDPETAKANLSAEIDSQNPKRLNLYIVIQLSGNTNVKSIDLEFGFYFGSQAIAA